MKVRFRIIRSNGDQLILVPLADEFAVPMIDNYTDLMQYTLEGEVDQDKLTLSTGWDDEHKKK